MELTLVYCLISSICVAMVTGHARLIDPPGRSTMWRYGFNTPRNTDDHQLSCGGFGVQFYQNGGKCGVCGDRYDGVRENEAGGKFATGTIVHTYNQGGKFTARVEITVNHGGWFEFKLCPVNDRHKKATQDCFDKYLLRQTNGATRYQVRPGLGPVAIELELPMGLTCSQCVLQWRWNTASNVACDGANCCRGCGPQEQFLGCADIKINGNGYNNNNNNNNSPYHPPIVVAQTPAPTPKPTIAVVQTVRPFQPVQPVQPVQTSNNIGFPGSFIPVSAGSGPVVLPPVQPTGCQATPNFRAGNLQADQWCVSHCATGYCPSAYCESGCRAKAPLPVVPVVPQTGPVCRAKSFWQQRFPTPSMADKWCSDKCSQGHCPLDYCEQSCWGI